MTVAYTLTLNTAAVLRYGTDVAFRLVTDTTRRVLNRAVVLTPVDTGLLRSRNQMRVQRTAKGAAGEVFNITVYARPVHDGSRAHIIRPVHRKALRFVVGGEVVFARSVRMPARRGRPWLLRALKEVAGADGYRMVT